MDSISRDWAELALPATLPQLVVTPDAAQIFMFSAVTWNRHHIHYNRDAAVRDGLPDVAVQRGLLGNYFARLLTQWTGPAAHVRELSWKVQRSAFPGQPLRVQGEAVERDQLDGQICLRCTLTMLNDSGHVVASGAAVLAPAALGQAAAA